MKARLWIIGYGLLWYVAGSVASRGPWWWGSIMGGGLAFFAGAVVVRVMWAVSADAQRLVERIDAIAAAGAADPEKSVPSGEVGE